MKFRTLALLFAVALVSAGCSGDTSTSGGAKPGKETPAPAEAGKNIVETAVAADGFDKLVAAVKAAELVDALSGDGPFTVFAPTDEAFGEVEGLDELLKDKEKLSGILKYHVVGKKVMAGDIKGDMEAPTLQGGKLEIKVADGKVTVNGAAVVKTD